VTGKAGAAARVLALDRITTRHNWALRDGVSELKAEAGDRGCFLIH
jgi:hypothetical protein